MRASLLAGVLVACLLAGCGEASPDAMPGEPEGAAELELAATAATGILRGLVVDAAIRPLAGVQILVESAGGPRTMNTTTNGLFGFDGLAPGAYTIQAEKEGFKALQTTATVVAGVDDAPYARLLLEADSSYRPPYVEALKISGFIECTGSPVALCGIPNNYRPMACETHELLCYDNVTADSTLFWMDFEGNTSFLQAELVWTPSSSFSQQLGWNKVAGEGCAGIVGMNNATHGPSPMVAPMVPPEIREPGGETCVLYVGVGAGPPDEATCLPVPVPLFNTICAGVAVEQAFDVFVHAFYGHLPPSGWAFTADGEAPTPP